MWSHFLHVPILARFWICFVSVRIETWNNYNLEVSGFLEAENKKYAENDLLLLCFYVITSHKEKHDANDVHISFYGNKDSAIYL